jgi:hypothetical protein
LDDDSTTASTRLLEARPLEARPLTARDAATPEFRPGAAFDEPFFEGLAEDAEDADVEDESDADGRRADVDLTAISYSSLQCSFAAYQVGIGMMTNCAKSNERCRAGFGLSFV